jgi:hypothetical protein
MEQAQALLGIPPRRRAKEPAQFLKWEVQGRGADHNTLGSHSDRGIRKGARHRWMETQGHANDDMAN